MSGTAGTVTRVAQTHEVLDVQFTGDRVEPCRLIESPQFGWASWFHDGLIFQGQIDEMPDTLSNWTPKTDALDEALT